MKVDVLEKEGNQMTLLLNGIPVVTTNSLRRASISQVPTMAIEHVFFYENNSVMNDQVMAQRLGFIPLTTNLQDYLTHEECGCETEYGCPRCSVTLTLDARAEESIRIVHSGDISSQDDTVVPIDQAIPIVKLAPGQKVILEMRATLGRGEDHAKWQPLSKAVVRGVPVFAVDEDSCDDCKACVKACPKDIILLNPKPVLKDLYGCTTCRLCAEACPQGSIKINIDESSSILSVESLGQLSPEEIIDRAISILIEKMEKLGAIFEDGIDFGKAED